MCRSVDNTVAMWQNARFGSSEKTKAVLWEKRAKHTDVIRTIVLGTANARCCQMLTEYVTTKFISYHVRSQ